MLQRLTLLAITGLALGTLADAQEPTKTDPAPKADAKDKTAADYVRDLGSDNFRTRSQAERALRGLGQVALPELKKAAAEGGDAETQWRARRLVRQIERGADGGLARRDQNDAGDQGQQRGQARGQGPWRTFAWPGGQDMQQRFDELFHGLESDFGLDVPRARFFHDDFFKDLQQQMDSMRQQMQSGPAQGQSMQMQMGPNGVRVEIKTKNDKGEEESKVYEAPDMETFRQKYPDVLRQHGLGFGLGNGMRVFQFGDGPMVDFNLQAPRAHWQQTPGQPNAQDDEDQDQDQGMDLGAAPAVVLPPPGKRLGVVVKQEIPAEVRSYLGIDGGLMVEQVQDGTLAQALGLEAGDIVLEIGGKAIAGTKDVQDALGGIAAGSRVDVKLLRHGKELAVHADKQEDQAKAPAPLEKRTPAKDAIR